MMIAQRFRIPLVLQIAIFLIPMNVYVIGDWMGAGIQWVFLRFIQFSGKNSIVLLPRELGMILSGSLSGKSAFASIIWAVGAVLIIVATVLIISGAVKTNPDLLRKVAFVNTGAAVLFVLSTVFQYGILLHGPAGISIPFGILVLLIIAYWQYQIACTSPVHEENIAESR